MTRIGFIVLLSALAVAPLAPAAAQDLLWNYQTGSNSNDVSRAVAVDSAGNAYIVGRTSGSLFGQVFGRRDAFVAKIDPSGALLWSRQFGTAESEEAEGVAVDMAGSVYIVGLTGGSLGQPNAGARDLYLTKFDASSALVWTRQEGTSWQDYGTGVALDNAGNVYISGGTSGSLFEQSAGNYDAFVAKYDASGALLWAHHLGTPAKDYSHGVAVDSAGSVFITGWTEGILGASQHGSRDAFVAKYNALGTLLWTRQFGGSGNEEGFGVAVDSAGNVFVTGYREKGWGAFFRDQDDLFLTKYDSRGTYLWMNHIGLQHKEWAQAVAVDSAGNAYITGHTVGSLGGPNIGRNDLLLVKCDPSGKLLYIKQTGTELNDYGWGIAADHSGNVYVTGHTEGSFGAPIAGGDDIFLAKFGETCYADCDQSTGVGVLDIIDFLCFQDSFVSGTAYACDCDTSTGPLVCDIIDFLCFQDAFVAGCP